MSDKAHWFDAVAPAPRGQAQRELTRSERLGLFHAACSAMADGKVPPREAAKFVGVAGLAWLQDGGSLERDHLKLSAPRGSHLTAEALWRLIDDEDFSKNIADNAAHEPTR